MQIIFKCLIGIPITYNMVTCVTTHLSIYRSLHEHSDNIISWVLDRSNIKGSDGSRCRWDAAVKALADTGRLLLSTLVSIKGKMFRKQHSTIEDDVQGVHCLIFLFIALFAVFKYSKL